MEVKSSFLDKLGLVKVLIPGYIALFIFCMGEGIDKAWISKFFSIQGFSPTEIGIIIGVYGAMVAIASWFSGVLTDKWGPRKVMGLGVTVWLVFQALFLTLGIKTGLIGIALTYGLRGLGYPLFAFSFITWIAYAAPKERLGRAMGWFWFAHTLGFSAFSGYLASSMRAFLPDITVLWMCAPWIVAGGALAVGLVKGKVPIEKPPTFREAIGVVKENYRTGVISIVRIINTAGLWFALPVFMALWVTSIIGFSTSEWLLIWGSMFVSNVIWNLLWGFIGDKIGWRKCILWFGGIGCGISMLLFYYVPLVFGPSFLPLLLVGIVAGALLAAYVPLSAIAGVIIPEKRGCVMGLLNFGAGLSFFIGGSLGGIIYGSSGAIGVVWLFAILYFAGAGLTILLPKGKGAEK
jgi:polyol permease family